MDKGKDHATIIRFMTAFEELREKIGDAPEGLFKLANEDPDVKSQALELEDTTKMLLGAERSRPELFSAPVDPGFIATWRDFENRYKGPLSNILIHDLIGLGPTDRLEDNDRREHNCDEIDRRMAEDEVQSLKEAIDFAYLQIWDETRDFDPDYVLEIDKGINTWDKLSAQFGSDLAGVLRRRKLVPFFLIPRHVSGRHGETEKLSLLTHLQQAQTAFVCGAPLAALALMRTLMEVTLREHYGAEGGNLKQWIGSCEERLPDRAPVSALDRLRREANAVLHFNQDETNTPDSLENGLLQHLYVLRELIEGAPE